MDSNKLLKNIIWGVSAVIGLAVAEGIYRTGIGAVNKRELIGDGEIISEQIENIDDSDGLKDEDVPF